MSAAVVFAALAAWLAGTTRAPNRLRALRPREARTPASTRLRTSQLWTSPWFAAVLAVVAVTRLLDGIVGVSVGVAAAIGVHRWVAGLESAGERRRREQVARDLPMAVDLMIAAMAAGRPHGQVLSLVGQAVGGPLADELAAVVARLDLGADPLATWREVARRPGLEPLGRSFARSTETGAPLGSVLSRTVDDLRAERRAHAQYVARAVGVRTAAPLGACFLPAFFIVGIVPTLVGAFQHLVL